MKEIDRVIAQELFFERYKYVSVNTAVEQLELLFNNLKTKLSNETKYYNKRQINALLTDIKKELTVIYSEFNINANQDIVNHINFFYKKESSFLDIKLDKNILDEIYNPQKQVLGYTLLDMIEIRNNNQVRQLNSFLTQNLLAGENPENYINELNNIILVGSNAKLKTITRTITKQLREDVREKIDNEVGNFEGFISLSTLDSRTSSKCILFDKKIYLKKDGYNTRDSIEDRPPRHFNCRSIIVRYDETSELSYTRASKGDEGGKQVNSKTSFDSFLRRNPNTAIKLMGETRAKLFLNNKLDIKDFINENTGKFFTIDELEFLI